VSDILREAARLAGAGEPFALATVVRVTRPASARRGDRGIVTADGALVGWVGGACSEPIVVREALRAVADGAPRLVRIGPPGTPGGDDVVCAESHCASEGVVEVLVEPQLPAPLLAIVGDGPAARTLAELAAAIGWRVTDEADVGAAAAVVVATMGTNDEEALAAALAGTAGYVALVASARRAGVVLGALREAGVPEEALARVRSPAGLDLGPCTQQEIAVAVLAELVAWRHAGAPIAAPPAEAVDPVCGMTVAVEGAADTAEHGGRTWYFCCPHCRAALLEEPSRYAGVAIP
jgi:xanthine dehydrogenase accessory factor